MLVVRSVLLAIALTVPYGQAVLAQNFDEGMAATMAYENGDYETALSKWRPLAEKGDAWAQFGLGYLHLRGKGVPRDHKEALKWFFLAAEQGIAPAQYRVGSSYLVGIGIEQNTAEAMRWLRLAAEKGNVDAQYFLGTIFQRGEFIPQNYAEAMTWYRQAAEKGHAEAHLQLGAMYRFGEGVPQDFVAAHMWFNLGAAVEPDTSSATNKMFRDDVAKKMTVEQIAEAQTLARKCLNSGYKNCGW